MTITETHTETGCEDTLIIEPAVKQFYFGEEAVKSRLKPGQLPFPKSTWKDLYNQLNDEYEGASSLGETYLQHFISSCTDHNKNFIYTL